MDPILSSLCYTVTEIPGFPFLPSYQEVQVRSKVEVRTFVPPGTKFEPNTYLVKILFSFSFVPRKFPLKMRPKIYLMSKIQDRFDFFQWR